MPLYSRPKRRFWQAPQPKGNPVLWAITALICGGGVFAALRYGPTASKAEVPVTKVRVADFAISVRSRGVVRSVRSDILTAPQVPDLRIVKLAESGKPIKQGEAIVEFEVAPPEQPAPRKDNRNGTLRAKNYPNIVERTQQDGMVSILPNFRSDSFSATSPPFKEGDRVWAGAAIAEILDLSKMRLEWKLEEVDRGKVRLKQPVKVHVDALPDRDFNATLDWISPIATVAFKGMGLTEKTFSAYAILQNTAGRLKPGMTGTAQIVIERQPSQLLIPIRASFAEDGKPAVYLQTGNEFVPRPIEVGKRNDTDIVVLKGLKQDDVVALENPAEAAKRARKLQ